MIRARPTSWPRSRWVGVGLVAFGVFGLLLQTRGVWAPSFAWTLYAILPGVVCLLAAPLLGRAGLWLGALGATLVGGGLLLFAIGIVDGWLALVYAWPLVVPACAGLALWLAPWSPYTVIGRQMVVAGFNLSSLCALATLVLSLLAVAGWAASALAGSVLLIGLGGSLLLRR